MGQDKAKDENFGILLGWQADPAGERFALTLQSTRKVVEAREDVREFRYYMSREQAVQLGTYLFRITGETAPSRKRAGFFDRLLGG